MNKHQATYQAAYQTNYSNKIAVALNEAFATHQIVTKVGLRQGDGLLYITLEPIDGQSESALTVKPLLAHLRQTLRQAKADLSLGWTKLVKVSGRLSQQSQPLWQEELLLSAAPAIARRLAQPDGFSPPPQKRAKRILRDASSHNAGEPLIVGSDSQLYTYMPCVEHGGVLNTLTSSPTSGLMLGYTSSLTLSIAPRPTPLSLRLDPFDNLLDRQHVLSRLREALSQSIPVEVYAKPGFGKTTLIQHVSHQADIVGKFVDGVLYLQTNQLLAADLLQSLYDALYETTPAFKPSYSQIQQSLKEKAALVILDEPRLNKEEMAWLIAALPKCTFLLVSEERLYWRGGADIALDGLPTEAAIARLQQDLSRTLSKSEQTAASLLCAALFGNPLHLRRAAAQIMAQAVSLTTWLASMQAIQRRSAAAHAGLTAADLEKLTLGRSISANIIANLLPGQKQTMAVMGAMAGITLTAEQTQAIAQLPDTAGILNQLADWYLVESDDIGYRICADLTEVVNRTLDPQPWLQSAVRYFTGNVSTQNIDAMLHLLEWTQGTGQWQRSLSLVRRLDRPLAMGRHWQRWEQTLTHSLQAAQQLGDGRMEAWALHQLGTSAIALGNPIQAEYWLSRAIGLRERGQDAAGAAVSRHNLGLLVPPLVSGESLTDEKAEPESRKLNAFARWAAVAGVVVVGAVVVGVGGGFLRAGDRSVPLDASEQKATEPSGPGNESGSDNAQVAKSGDSVARPELNLDTEALDFGKIALGQSGRETLRITNSGQAALDIGSLKTADGVDFEVTDQTCTADELLPEQTCVVSVLFEPSVVGDRVGQLIIESNVRDRTVVPLAGAGAISRRASPLPFPIPTSESRSAPSPDPTAASSSNPAASDSKPTAVANPDPAPTSKDPQPPAVQEVSLYLQQGTDFEPGGSYTFNLLQSSQAYDPDGDTVEISSVSAIDANGKLQNNADGSVTFFPDSNVSPDQYGEYSNSFRFTVVDSAGKETDSVVSITVTIPPPTQEYFLNQLFSNPQAP